MDCEQWRPCVGYNGYDVSDHGRVRSWRSRNGRGRARTPRIISRDTCTVHGYPIVCLQRDGDRQQTRFVHALVLEAFVGPCPVGMECRHFPDRTRTNNALSNLQWGTPQQNADDRETHGTNPRGDDHWSKLEPHRIVRGDDHWMRKNPERVPRLGDRHWTRAHPERLKRGDDHHFRRMPECVPRGPEHSAAMRGISRGEKNPRCKITEAVALAIITELRAGARPSALMRKYADRGVTKTIVEDIARRKSWSHLQPIPSDAPRS